MNKDLELGFKAMIKEIKKDSRCKGCWHYGSVGRGMADEYSDYDPVFLVTDEYFEDFSKDVKKYVQFACDELLISWAEDYNSDHFKNFCNLIRIKDKLHQLDFFILNEDRKEEWWCRQHLKGCTRKNIEYDNNGDVSRLLDKELRTDNNIPDPIRCFETYWFHTEMLIKYFKRGDIFKIIKNIEFLFHSHINILLSEYDILDWGAWETKIKLCVPQEKQNHLLNYYTNSTLLDYEKAIKKSMKFFYSDAKEIFLNKGLEYPKNIADQVIKYFNIEVNCK